MSNTLFSLLSLLLSAFKERRELALENLALRQQLAMLKRSSGRPQLRKRDRLFWAWLSLAWNQWCQALVFVKPETVVRWQRKRFQLFWTRLSRRKCEGRPAISPQIRALIRKMAEANPLWGAPRIHGELLKLGMEVSERTVSRLMPRDRKPSSQTWKAFLSNHLDDLISIDFFTVPTVTFRVLFVLVVISHQRRRVVHFNVTEHPTAIWTAQQMVEAFPEDTAPRYLLRDRDKIYGYEFRQRIRALGIEEVLSAPASPWQQPFVERLIGSVRRDCLDHVVVLGERHLRKILKSYFEYYHHSRTHLGLAKDTPDSRAVQLPALGRVIALPEVGGLHHRYERRAA
jgi:putative transposase